MNLGEQQQKPIITEKEEQRKKEGERKEEEGEKTLFGNENEKEPGQRIDPRKIGP